MSVAQPIDEHESSQTPVPLRGRRRSRVLTLVFTDLAGSVALKARLGDTVAGELIARHFSHLRALAFETGGREIVSMGDGLLLSFEVPTAAVEFALNLQSTHFSQPDLPSVRIGIHLGEVTEEETTSPGGHSSVTVEGLAVDLCARIQSLALPRQVLLSYSVFDSARQRLRSDHLGFAVSWIAHGRYLIKGYEQALEVYEAGIEGLSPLVPPVDTEKARRDVGSLEETLLGWRPAQALELPGRPNWILVEKLGEGGFGDVWLAEHRKTRDKRVIKFCYSPDKLTALKREVTLFRVLKEALGDREDIARVTDYQFEQPPFYLEMEYAGSSNLKDWLERRGEGGGADLETRVEIVAQIAEAIGAAHSVGVLHKDIKPSNILINRYGEGRWQARVIDFGIGALTCRSALEANGITAGGLTELSGSINSASISGTRIYMAPELLEGKPATTQSDIYSLGVLLYQVVTGRLEHALAPGWERDIADELLREDIALSVDGVPDQRLASARELAERLRSLPRRREQVLLEKQRQEKLLNQRRKRPLYWAVAGALSLLLFFGALFAWQLHERASLEQRLRTKAEGLKDEAIQHAALATAARHRAEQAHYFSTIQAAGIAASQKRIEKARDVLLRDTPEPLRQLEWGWLYAQTSQEDFSLRRLNAYDAVFSPDNSFFATGDRDNLTSGTGWVTFYDARTGKRIQGTQVHNQLIWDLRFSPDGKRLVTASSDRTAAIVDARSLQVLVRLQGHTGILRAAAFSPDAATVVTVARDESIRQWNSVTGEQIRRISVPGQALADLQFSPGGKTYVTTAIGGRVRQWDLESGASLAEYPGHGDSVLSACFGPDNTLITACKDGLIRFFPYAEDGTTSGAAPVRTLSTSGTWPSAIIYSAAGNFLAVACDDGQGRIYDYNSMKLLLEFQTDEPTWKIDSSQDGKSVLLTSRWSVRRFNLDRLRREPVFENYRGDTLSSDVLKVQVSSIVVDRDTTWRFDRDWRTTSGRTLITYGKQKFAADSFYSVFSPDDTQCIRIDDQTLSVTVLAVPSARVLAQLPSQRACAAAYSEDGKLAAIAGMHNRAEIWDTATWKLLHVLERATEYCTTLRFTRDSTRLLVGYTDGAIVIWDTTSGKPLLDTGWNGHSVLALDVSADGKLMASGHSSDRATVWDLHTGKQISTLSGHVRYVHSIAFSPDGARVLTAARDGTAKLWDAQTGRELITPFDFAGVTQVLTAFFVPQSYQIGAITADHRIILSDYFPWDPDSYPGDAGIPLYQRIELWKRQQRIDTSITMADLQTRY